MIAIYLIILIPIVVYIGILKEKNTLLTNRIKMTLYIFFIPILTIFLSKILEFYLEDFFYSIWQISFVLCLAVYALIEEFLKFYFAPLIIKNKKQFNTVVLYTGLLFSLFETLLKFMSSNEISYLLYRLLTTTPLHLFLAFTFCLSYNQLKDSKLKYFIPILFNIFIHTVINVIAYYQLFNGLLLLIFSIIATITMIEMQQKLNN